MRIERIHRANVTRENYLLSFCTINWAFSQMYAGGRIEETKNYIECLKQLKIKIVETECRN